ncbi:MAG: HAD-IIIA family hydrolase [Calditrichaeota bacterium]|nr:HAD-IIIA family hydrolase [Calditrichota bacterium]
MVIENLKGVIFDVHKTLVDDSGFPRDRIWRLIEKSGVTVNRELYFELYDKITRQLFNWPEINPFVKVREIHRRRLQQIYRHFNVDRNIENDLNFLWESLAACQFYPEVPEVLHKLSGKFKLALLSNADADDPLLEIVRRCGVKFDAIVTSEQAKCYKPDRKIYELTLKKLALSPAEAIMVGDSPAPDIGGAKNVGIRAIWINRHGKIFNEYLPKPDWEIQSLSAIFEVLNL